MDPVIFTLGPFPVHWYGVMMAAGFFAALATWIRLGRRTGFGSAFCSDLLIWIMVSGIVGARVAYVASRWEFYKVYPHEIFYVWQGGLVFYGGFIGSGVALAILARVQKVPFLELVDLVVPGLAIGHAFGRLGCFINHCCYGSLYDGPCSVMDPSTGLRVHPVQIYEAAANILIYVMLIAVYRKRAKQGAVIVAYLLSYPIVRFVLEFVRGDDRIHTGVLTLAQTTSIILFAVGLLIYFIPRGPART